MITLPPPVLPTLVASTEEPLKALLTGLRNDDGSTVTKDQITFIGVFVFRGAQFWDDKAKQWIDTPPDTQLLQRQPLAAIYKEGATPAWEATIVGLGQKDAAGADVYSPAVGGAPTYFLRAFVTTAGESGEKALSAPSPPFTFVDAATRKRFSLQFQTPDTKAEAANRVRIQLKGDALQVAGFVEVRAQPSFEVEIANCDASGNKLAQVLLRANGEIVLTPATGARVTVDGDIETNRVLYAPSGGGAKQWL
jgi:hypothetical protein